MIIRDHLRRRFIHLKLGTHLLDLRGLLFELRREIFNFLLLLRDGRLELVYELCRGGESDLVTPPECGGKSRPLVKTKRGDLRSPVVSHWPDALIRAVDKHSLLPPKATDTALSPAPIP